VRLFSGEITEEGSRPVKIAWVAAAAVLVLAGFACGGNGDGPADGAATPAPAREATPAPARTWAPSDQDEIERYTIEAKDFAFEPSHLDVDLGFSQIFFTNLDAVQHTLNVYDDAEYRQPLAGAAASGTIPFILVLFRREGTYYFRCEIHPEQMQGTIEAK
jgi:plastocyanin